MDENSVVKDFLTTAPDGKNRHVKFYSLDMILSVGCRVKSRTAARFRPQAAARLREYIIKGFLLDDERLTLSISGPTAPKPIGALQIGGGRKSEKRM